MKQRQRNNRMASPLVIAGACIVSALIIMVVCYLQNNVAYAVFDDISHYSRLEYLRRLVSQPQAQDSDVLYINVAYDKKLVDYFHPDFGFPEGLVDITDRSKLYRLLSIARKADNYKYIFLDVRFEKGYDDLDTIDGKTVDEALYHEIAATPRLVVSHHAGMMMADSVIAPKTALNDYYSTITETNLVRYPYLEDGEESVALRMFREINGGGIARHGLLYTSGGKLCYNCPFLRLSGDFPPRYNDDGTANYYNLGVDLLDICSDSDIMEMLHGKVVIIGNFIEDTHDTYVGSMPGSFFTYNAYKSLTEGRHLVNWWFVWLSFFLYLAVSVSMFSTKSLADFVSFLKLPQSGLVSFLVTLLGYSALMLICSDLLYLFCDQTASIWFPSLYFSVMSTILKYLRK